MTPSRFCNDGLGSPPALRGYLNFGNLESLREDTVWLDLQDIARLQKLAADGFEGVQLVDNGPPPQNKVLPYCGLDFRLSPSRDTAAAMAFFRKALRMQECAPVRITLDGYAASHQAVREMQRDGLLPKPTKLRSSKYLNNLIEQDHRGITSRTRPMLGFKTMTLQSSPLPASNCSTASAHNSHSDAYVSRIKLRLQSGMPCSPHKNIASS